VSAAVVGALRLAPHPETPAAAAAASAATTVARLSTARSVEALTS
jgi:hypothetical protein